ncbi:acyl-CoA thioesterase [Microbacterium sp. MC2]
MTTPPIASVDGAARGVIHSHTVRLSYGDTDPAGILYYAAWFPKMEALQSEFLFLQGMRQDTLVEQFGWWTVSRATECEYLAAARLFDQIRIDLRVGRIGASSFRFEFAMTRVDDNVLVARAANTVVTVSPDQRPIRIPDGLRARLEQWAEGAE